MSNDDIQEFVIDCITDPENRDKQAALDKWLQKSEENQVLYEEIKRIWDIAETIPSTPFNKNEGWDLLAQHITETPVKVRKMSGWWRAAAVLVPLCMVAVAWWQYSERGHKEADWVNFVAQGTIKDSLLLPDGSVVYAKPGTTLAYNKQRIVKLEKGEAFFKVVQNEKTRFVVQMKNATVTVLGTSFNITVDSALTDVAVWDGKVSMARQDGEVIVLKEGEMGRLDKNNLNKMAGNYAWRCGWANGYLIFENEEAGVVAAVLSKYYHQQITIADSLVKKRITVRFRNMSFEEVQAVLAEVLDK
jgi:transmembrane sensor